MLNKTHLGILRDIKANKVSLDEMSDWLRDQLCDIIMLDGPMLIDTRGPEVFLTDAGHKAVKNPDQQSDGGSH